MINSEFEISSRTAQQILLEAEQNGLAVEQYLQKIASRNLRASKSYEPKVRQASIKVDFFKTHEWLKNNRDNHIGKWIVLDGDRLIGSGQNPLPFVEKARAEGVETPFVQFISDDTKPFMGGWL